MSDQTKLCPQCAEEIPAEAQFCSFCGARFDSPALARPGGSQPASSRQLWIIGILVGLIGLIACGVMIALLLVSRSRSQPTAVSQKPTTLPSATTRPHLPADTPQASFTPSPIPPSLTITATSRPAFTPTPKFTPTRKPTSTPSPIPGLAIPPNAACFNYTGGEITCLDDTGWHTFTRDDMSYWVFDFAFCPDGNLWLSTTQGIGVSDGQAWTFYTDQPSGDLACGPNGSLWVVTTSEKELRHFDGQQWTAYPPVGKLGKGDYADTIMDIAVSPTGLVWIGTLSSIASFDGTNWTIYEEGQGFQDQISAQTLVIDSQGKVWVSSYDGVWMFDGKKWTPFESQNLSMPQALAIDSRDRLWIGTYDNGISMYDGSDWTVYRRSNSKLSSDSIKSLAIDAQDRVWVGTEWGLNIFDGNNWQAYHVHTSDLVRNEIAYLTVGGKGPILPPLMEKTTGTLEGSLVNGTQPVSGAEVEICVEYIGFMFSGTTPCSGQPFVRSTTTDANGSFTFSDLPAGQYTVTFRAPGGKWMQYSSTLSIGSEQATVNPGETTTLAEMDISKSK